MLGKQSKSSSCSRSRPIDCTPILWIREKPVRTARTGLHTKSAVHSQKFRLDNMTSMELDLGEVGTAKLLFFTKKLAIEAGTIIRKAFLTRRRADYDLKSETDPVTETDHEVENMLFTSLRAVFPDHKFIGEESASGVEWTDDPTWIIDPIDGTANCT